MDRALHPRDQDRFLTPLLLCAALFGGCAAPEREPEPAPAPEPPPERIAEEVPLAEAEAEARARAQMQEVLFARHMAAARRYREALEPEEALRHVDQALILKPASEEARDLRLELLRMLGVRAGEAEAILADEWQAQKAREEQYRVAARRALAEAREAEASGDYERAIAAYERVIFLARAADDRDLEALRTEAEKALEAARR